MEKLKTELQAVEQTREDYARELRAKEKELAEKDKQFQLTLKKTEQADSEKGKLVKKLYKLILPFWL